MFKNGLEVSSDFNEKEASQVGWNFYLLCSYQLQLICRCNVLYFFVYINKIHNDYSSI